MLKRLRKRLKKTAVVASAALIGLSFLGTVQLTSTAATDVELSSYQMEYLDRGVVAVNTEDGVFVSWRLLGTESDDIAFNLYRDGKKVNDTPITTSTNYLDDEGTLNSVYYVSAVLHRQEIDESKEVSVWAEQYLSIPLEKPEGGITPDGVAYEYTANDASVGDLTGDGNYEIILKWDPTNSKDNAHSGYTGNVYIDAYTLQGEKLWRIDAGRNIRAGAHYTQFLVYDFDGNGRSEVVFKTADGTVDGQGNVIGDANADYRNNSGYILDGPEFLTVFDGETGAALETIDYYPPRGNVSAWGDGYGNRVDRFLAGVAYLDGERPSIVMARGYYTRTVLAAYNWRDGELSEVWVFDSNDPGNGAYAGQGNHSLAVADVDGDGKDEIIYGAMVVDHDGTGLYSTGWGHGDANHVSNLNPNRPGLEIFQVHESRNSPVGYGIRDAATGELLFGVRTGTDVGRGMAADIDPRYEGAELWASDSWDGSSGQSPLYSVEGEIISEKSPRSINHAIWWTGDLLRELLDHDFDSSTDPHGVGRIDKWDWENEELVTIFTPEGTRSNNWTKGNPSLQADLFGDWREEVIWPSSDSTELRIYTTTDLTEHRIYTLMHDRTYRLGVAWQNVAYNQPPHTGFFLGHGMDAPPTPNMNLVVPSSVDVKPGTFNGQLRGNVTIEIEAPSHVSLVDASELKVNGKTVSGNITTTNDGYQVKVDRRDFIRALDRHMGEVEVTISVTSNSGDVFIGRDTINVQTMEPVLSVVGPESVKVGDPFSLTYAVNGQGENIHSFEMKLSYDADTVEFVSVESLVRQLKIQTQLAEQPGEVRILVQGAPGHFFNNPDLFKLNMNAKETEEFVTDITVTDISYKNSNKELITLDDLVQSVDLYDDVSEILLSGENGSQAINTNRGTLQVQAEVSPANANQSVVWSVTNLDGSATEIASITQNGLLTGNINGLNGEVKVVAEAQDGSGVVGELIVEITKQLQLITGTIFGATPPWSPGSGFDKAFDGDTSTFFDFSLGNGGYAGIDVGEGNEVVLKEVRFFPRTGFTRRMTGGKIQGSNVSETEGFVDIYTISPEPRAGWNVVEINLEESYRYIRYLSPNGGHANVAELEFYTE